MCIDDKELFNMVQRSTTAEQYTDLASVEAIQSDGTIDETTSHAAVVWGNGHTCRHLRRHKQQFTVKVFLRIIVVVVTIKLPCNYYYYYYYYYFYFIFF